MPSNSQQQYSSFRAYLTILITIILISVPLLIHAAPLSTTLRQHIGTPISLIHHPTENAFITLSKLNILSKISYQETLLPDPIPTRPPPHPREVDVERPSHPLPQLPQSPKSQIEWRQSAPQIESPLEMFLYNNVIYTVTKSPRAHNHITSQPVKEIPLIYIIVRQFSLDGDLISQQSGRLECEPVSIHHIPSPQTEAIILRIQYTTTCSPQSKTTMYISYPRLPEGILGFPNYPPAGEIQTRIGTIDMNPAAFAIKCVPNSQQLDQIELSLSYNPTTSLVMNKTRTNMITFSIDTTDQQQLQQQIENCFSFPHPSTPDKTFIVLITTTRYVTILQSTTPLPAVLTNSEQQFLKLSAHFTPIFISNEAIPYTLSSMIVSPPPSIHSPFQRHFSSELIKLIITPTTQFNQYSLLAFNSDTMIQLSTYQFNVMTSNQSITIHPQFTILQVDGLLGSDDIHQHICIQTTSSGGDDTVYCISMFHIMSPEHSNDSAMNTTASIKILRLNDSDDKTHPPTIKQVTTMTSSPFITFIIPHGSKLIQLATIPTDLVHDGIPAALTSAHHHDTYLSGLIVLPPPPPPTPPPSRNIPNNTALSVLLFGPNQFDLESDKTTINIDTNIINLDQFLCYHNYLEQQRQLPTTLAIQPHYTYSPSTHLYSSPEQHEFIITKPPSSKPYSINQSRVLPYLIHLAKQSATNSSTDRNHLYQTIISLLETNCLSNCQLPSTKPEQTIFSPSDITQIFNTTTTFKAHKAVLGQSVVLIKSTQTGPVLELVSLIPTPDQTKPQQQQTKQPYETLLSMNFQSLFPFLFLTTNKSHHQVTIHPDSIKVFYTKSRITIVYTPVLTNPTKILPTTQPTARTFILTIDLYRLAQTPIIIPITAAVYSPTPLTDCTFTMGKGGIASSSVVCYNPAQRTLIQFVETTLTPPLSTTRQLTQHQSQTDNSLGGDDDDGDDDDDDQHSSVENVILLHQINDAYLHQSTIIPLSINHLLDRVRGIESSLITTTPPFQTQYESTATLCLNGIDLVCVDLTLDGSFDRIDHGRFRFSFLIATMVAVVVFFLFSRHRARVSAIQAEWK